MDEACGTGEWPASKYFPHSIAAIVRRSSDCFNFWVILMPNLAFKDACTKNAALASAEFHDALLPLLQGYSDEKEVAKDRQRF
ncbi:hypothetical protein [Hymenobacter properus]|uniref:Uncharacterized protein n=1 Tax=Hymenobacter properus TaxID=2791026 RepID=A0A931BF44_9BACT|nr:hypothetical protein [Hymenobacter properus]MBF9141381.1 hypothetical protein [Hymenobacter properus]MBR7720190.1 hypothetical protein [Microvirga sp. SRT04]